MPNRLRRVAHRALVCSALLAVPSMAVFAQSTAPEPDRSTPVLELRYRYEQVDDAAFARDADANTVRLRLGYRWVFAPNWRAYVTGDRVQALFGDHYNSTANGKTQYPVVADPESSQINQAYVAYADNKFGAAIGRQRVLLDNHRFFGNVGWRQNEQTFDALSLNYNFVDNGPSIHYIWLDRVQRVYGHDHPNPLLRAWDLDGHLLNVSQTLPVGTLVGYAYFVENYDIATLSTRNVGARWTGKYASAPFQFGWTVEYARQNDWANNPSSQQASYRLIEPTLVWRGITFKAGQEVLGGNGRYGFATPYATLHTFDGWADRFLTTPTGGVDDRYLGAEGKIGKAAWIATWHDFHADHGSRSYGNELDASLAFPIMQHVTGLVKYADYRSDGFSTDERKFWIGVEYRY